MFGNTFDRPLKLPWGSGAALKFMQYVSDSPLYGACSGLNNNPYSSMCSFVDPTLEHALDSATPWALYVIRASPLGALVSLDSRLTGHLLDTGPHLSVRCRTWRIIGSRTAPTTLTEKTTGSLSHCKTTFHLYHRIRLRSLSLKARNSGGTFSVVRTSGRLSRLDLRYVPSFESPPLQMRVLMTMIPLPHLNRMN